MREHDDITIQLDFSDRHINLVETGYELAFRIGHLQDSSLQAKRVTPIKHILCASSDYLDAHGRPKRPQLLEKHQFLQYGLNQYAAMDLYGAKGKHVGLVPKARIKSNNGDFLKSMAIKGHGIVCLPTFLVADAVAQGLLEPLLPLFRPPEMHAYVVYPKNKYLPHRCRLLIEFLCDHFGDKPHWDAVCFGGD